MYRHVIVGVDGQPGGRDAAMLASQLAASAAGLTLVNVTSVAPVATHAGKLDLQLGDQAALPQLMAGERDLCDRPGSTLRVYANSVGAGLADAAEREQADLIVVGGSRRHGLTRLLAGDDVKSVMHQTPYAVAIAPAGYREHPRPLARIGVAFDERSTSLVALAHGGLLAEQLHCDLVAFGVVEPRCYPAGWGMVAVAVDDPSRELTAARRRYGHLDGLDVQLVYGQVFEELERFSRDVDLLVCGSRHQGAARRIVLGSTSEHLARHLETPLLIAPTIDAPALERWRRHRQALPA